MYSKCLQAALAICLVACSIGEAGAVVVRRNTSEEFAGQRLAIIKTDRSGSSFLFTHLKSLLCKQHHKCPEIKPELFNTLPRNTTYNEIRTMALGLLKEHLSCRDGDACGFSLSLQKHANWGYLQPGTRAFQDLVAVLTARGASVIILTRRDCFARSVSHCMARQRDDAIHGYRDLVRRYRDTARQLKGCDGFHVYRCPEDIQTRVMNGTFFCDEKVLEEHVKTCQSDRSAYQSFAQALGKEISGHAMSVEYEDLQSSSTWQALYEFAHMDKEGEAPKWQQHDAVDFKQAMRNYEGVTHLSRRLGYEWP